MRRPELDVRAARRGGAPHHTVERAPERKEPPGAISLLPSRCAPGSQGPIEARGRGGRRLARRDYIRNCRRRSSVFYVGTWKRVISCWKQVRVAGGRAREPGWCSLGWECSTVKVQKLSVRIRRLVYIHMENAPPDRHMSHVAVATASSLGVRRLLLVVALRAAVLLSRLDNPERRTGNDHIPKIWGGSYA